MLKLICLPINVFSDTFREVRLERLDGRNLLAKLELLMASLARGEEAQR